MTEIDELLAVTPLASPSPGSTDWVPVWNLASAPSIGPQVVIQDILIPAGQVLAAFDFTNIPQTFAHLRIEYAGLRTDSAAGQGYLMVNGDAVAADYSVTRRFWTEGTTAHADTIAASTLGTPILGDVNNTGDWAMSATSGRITIPGYTGAAFKNFEALTMNPAGNRFMYCYGDYGTGTTTPQGPITRLTVRPTSGNFVAGGRMTLIGLAPANVLASGLIQPVPALTLPTSPGDGQQSILVDSLSAPTYSWLLQWSAAAARWLFIGGPPLLFPYHDANGWGNLTTTGQNTGLGQTAYVDAAAVITVPRAGAYQVFGSYVVNNNGTGSGLSISAGAMQRHAGVWAAAANNWNIGWVGPTATGSSGWGGVSVAQGNPPLVVAAGDGIAIGLATNYTGNAVVRWNQGGIIPVYLT